MMATQKIKRLISEVEELLAELGDEQGPEVVALRNRLENAIAGARASVDAAGDGVLNSLKNYVVSLDEYVTGYPRLAFMTGAAIAGTLGYLAGTIARTRA